MFPLKDRTTLPGAAIVTVFLVIINALVFYLELTSTNLDHLIATYAVIPANMFLSNPLSWLPLLTSQFLHGGWFHLLTNMWFLLIFGPNMERAWGSARFLIFYLLAGIGAAMLQLLFLTDPNIPMLGASGAIAGVLGAYFVYFPHHRISTLVPLGFIPIFVGIPAGLILLYWFGLQIVSGFYGLGNVAGGVAFFAHIGGFLAGIIMAVVTRPRGDIASRTPFA